MFIILFMQNALSFMRTAVFVEVVLSGGAEIAGPEIGKMQDQKMRDQ